MDVNELLDMYAQEGFYAIEEYEEEKVILDYIAEHQEECPIELYRGMMVEDCFEIKVGDKVEFEHEFASFDEDFEKAKEFALRRTYGVVYVLENAVGLPLYMHANTCHDEKEWLIPGEFVVTYVEEAEDIKIVTIEVEK